MDMREIVGEEKQTNKSSGEWRKNHFYFGAGYCSKKTISHEQAERIEQFLTRGGKQKSDLIQTLLTWSAIWRDNEDVINSLCVLRARGNEKEKTRILEIEKELGSLRKQILGRK